MKHFCIAETEICIHALEPNCQMRCELIRFNGVAINLHKSGKCDEGKNRKFIREKKNAMAGVGGLELQASSSRVRPRRVR